MSQDVFEGKSDRSEDNTVGSRKKQRDQLQTEIEAYLAKGGKIEKVDAHVTADPPQKPGNNYTSRPI